MSDDEPRHFVKAWRKHRKLTQVQLAERIGMARSYLALIESGKRRYDQPFLEGAAAVLNCTPADLIATDPAGAPSLMAVWSSIPDKDRPQAIAILRTFAK